MNRVSIIVPAYNCARFLEAAINSVLAQSAPNFELIVVDDGSTDNTLAVARDKANADARVRVFNQEHSGKPAVARNAGIRQATGDFIAFLDGDDLYAPDRIARVAEVFAKFPDLDLVFHDVLLTDESGQPQGETFLAQNDYLSRAGRSLEDQATNVSCPIRFTPSCPPKLVASIRTALRFAYRHCCANLSGSRKT